MQTVQVGEFKADFSRILEQVQSLGEKFVIEYGKRHKKVAMLVPYEEEGVDKVFEPRQYYGAANVSKDEIDRYLQEGRDEWDDHL